MFFCLSRCPRIFSLLVMDFIWNKKNMHCVKVPNKFSLSHFQGYSHLVLSKKRFLVLEGIFVRGDVLGWMADTREILFRVIINGYNRWICMIGCSLALLLSANIGLLPPGHLYDEFCRSMLILVPQFTTRLSKETFIFVITLWRAYQFIDWKGNKDFVMCV